MTAVGKIAIKKDPEAQARAGADIFCSAAETAIARKGFFAAALAGGGTPRPMHRLLAADPHRSAIDWQHTHIFWVDERMVPANHPDSNFGLARKDLLDHVPLPAVNIHPMPTAATPEQGALQYQRLLAEFFKPPSGQPPAFDLIYLGIGRDGHTASLFPGESFPETGGTWVVAARGGIPDVSRLTLTFEVLNGGAQLVFLVSGKEKAAVVKTVLEERSGELPAQRIRPPHRNVTWLLDRSAASRLAAGNRNG